MDAFLLRILQRQIRDQCVFALHAAESINEGLRDNDSDAIFFGIQNFLNASANISKMLWGQAGKRSEARRPLRQSIGIDDASPLRDVNMRNNFEHMDERIDRWWEISTQKHYADRNIGPLEMIKGSRLEDVFRIFDPSTAKVGFWGQEFNIQTIVDEILAKLPTIDAAISNPRYQ